jgi:SAM-dependent methyltransferase
MSKNSWQQEMYDDYFASKNIDTKLHHKQAKKEVSFLLKILNLEKGDRVLDVPCGTGRHSIYFSKAGLDVTGVDISKACLKRAKDNAKNLDINFQKVDMVNLKQFQGQFDCVVNLFTSFGYFHTDKENEKVLRQMVACLKKGGKLVIHLINRDWLLKVYRPVSWHQEGDLFWSESRKYNFEKNYNESNLIVLNERSGKAKRYYHRCRCYSQNEMIALFKKAGLKKVKVYGDALGNSFQKYHSTHPFYVGEKI